MRTDTKIAAMNILWLLALLFCVMFFYKDNTSSSRPSWKAYCIGGIVYYLSLGIYYRVKDEGQIFYLSKQTEKLTCKPRGAKR